MKHYKTRTARTPAFWEYPSRPMITHTIDSNWIPSLNMTKSKLQILKNLPKLDISKFWNKLYTRHTSWSCLIRGVNIKWIWRVLLKIQSGHNYVHRGTDGQGETSIPPFNFVEAGDIKKVISYFEISLWIWFFHSNWQSYLAWIIQPWYYIVSW